MNQEKEQEQDQNQDQDQDQNQDQNQVSTYSIIYNLIYYTPSYEYFLDLIYHDKNWTNLQDNQKNIMYNLFKDFSVKYYREIINKEIKISNTNIYDILDKYNHNLIHMLDKIINYNKITYECTLDILVNNFNLDINHKNRYGLTPLMTLHDICYSEMIDFIIESKKTRMLILLNKNADYNILDNLNYSLEDYNKTTDKIYRSNFTDILSNFVSKKN